MALSHILDEFISEESVKNLRVKELLLFLLGYAINELAHFWSKLNQGKTLTFMNQLHKIVEDIFNSNAKHSYVVNKQNLIPVFQTVLNIFEQQKENINQQNLSFQELIQLFIDILNQGLKIKTYNQCSKSLNLQLKYLIHKAVQFKAQKSNQKENLKDEKNKQMEIEFLEQKFNISNLEVQKEIISQKLCEICACPLEDSSFQQKLGQKSAIKISQCRHQYHTKCILQMIGHYMKENSSILYQGKESKRFQKIQVHKDWLTSLKCPGYQKCSVHMSFSEIHAILLNNQGQKSSKYLQRLYSMAFNDYINSRNIMPFQQLRQAFSSKSNDEEHQKSIKKELMFFCHTNGCNAIYEIDKTQLKQTMGNESSNLNDSLQNFTCISCHQSYCLKCFSPIHPTMTCKEFSISSSYLPEDRQLEKFIKTLRRPYMKCPKCHFYVDNWRGCSTVTCRCGIRFCYKCGSTECPYAKCLKEMAKQGKKSEEREEQEK